MKSVFLVVLLAAAATAAVVSYEVPDVADGDDMADVDVNEMPDVVMTDVDELADAAERLPQTVASAPFEQSWGIISYTDRLLYNTMHSAGPINGIHPDISISVGSRITAIRVRLVGPYQNGRLFIKSGGVRSNHVTFEVHTAWGRGYNITILIYGESALI